MNVNLLFKDINFILVRDQISRNLNKKYDKSIKALISKDSKELQTIDNEIIDEEGNKESKSQKPPSIDYLQSILLVSLVHYYLYKLISLITIII